MTFEIKGHGDMPAHLHLSAIKDAMKSVGLQGMVHVFPTERIHTWGTGSKDHPYIFINSKPTEATAYTVIQQGHTMIYKDGWDFYVPVTTAKYNTIERAYPLANDLKDVIDKAKGAMDDQYRIEHNPDLLQVLNKTMENSTRRELDEAKERLRDRERAAREIRERMTANLRNIEASHTKIMLLEKELESGSDAGEKLKKDWLSLLNDDKITDIQFKNDQFVISLEEMPIHASPSLSTFKGGPYTLYLDFERGRVRVEADPSNSYRGYWTSEDPHPHIGKNENPCFGNLDETVAVLFSQYELSALVYSLIDFLQSANQDDPAGQRVVNWPLIKTGANHDDFAADMDEDEDMDECPRCGDMEREDEFVEVYERVNYENDELLDPREVCRDCAMDHYRHSEWFDMPINNDAYDDEYEESVR